jgi:hypothetical protein
MNPQLWKLIQFKNNPCSRIILGDSRANKISAGTLKEITGKDYYNFSFMGGTLIDMMEAFWYANERVKLEEVYMGIDMNLYNDFEKNNNVKRTKAIMNSYFTYAFSKVLVTGMIKNIQKEYFDEDMEIGKPTMDFDTFWKYHLENIGKRFFQKYAHPDEFYQELSKISEYCKENNIKLVFFIPPNHVDWQHKITEYGLEAEYSRFLNDIQQLGIMYNMDVPDAYTENRNNFLDPVHTVSDSVLINTIWH